MLVVQSGKSKDWNLRTKSDSPPAAKIPQNAKNLVNCGCSSKSCDRTTPCHCTHSQV